MQHNVRQRLAALERHTQQDGKEAVLFIETNTVVLSNGATLPLDAFHVHYPAGTIIKIYDGIDPGRV